MRYWASTVFVVMLAFHPLALAAAPQSGAEESGWTFYGRFQGTSNKSGLVLKLDPGIGYTFNRYFQTSVGLPVYFVRESSTDLTTTNPGSANGIGNAYLNGQFSLLNPAVNYISNLVVTAPTGDRDRGFSTGRATIDWNNGFSHSFNSLTLFTNIGVANTVSDTSFFVRPFTSNGLVGHFDGGASLDLHRFVSVGASGYLIRGSGDQRIISKLIRRSSTPSSTGRGRPVFEENYETVASAEVANDQGFSSWLNIAPTSKVYFQAGYSHSSSYDLRSLFFGVGFRVGK